MLIQATSLNAGIRGLQIKPASTAAGCRKNLRALWDVFTADVYNDVLANGTLSLIARKSVPRDPFSPLSLWIQRKSVLFGPIADPLHIARHMQEKGIKQICFSYNLRARTSTFFAQSIEKALLWVLSPKGLEKVTGIDLWEMDGDYTAAVSWPPVAGHFRPEIPSVKFI